MNNRSSTATEAEDAAFRWLAKLNSSNLTQAEQEAFFAWMESSSLHQAAYIKAEELWQRGAVLERLPARAKARRWQFQAWQGWAVACSCLLVLGLVLFSNVASYTHDYSFQTAIGEQQDVQLEDGSHITLNTNTRLKMQFTPGSRIAYLASGEVFFDVKADQNRPFDIVTDFGVVRVIGTRFSVYQSESDASVTVVEGRVALGEKPGNTIGFEANIVLQANERSTLLSARSSRTVEKVDASAALAWRKKQLIFDGQPLSQVIADLNRYFPETIALKEVDLGYREITAVIQLSDIKTTLQALGYSLNLRTEVDPSGEIFTLVSDISPAP